MGLYLRPHFHRQFLHFANQTPDKEKVSRGELVGIIRGEAKMMGDSQDIIDYVDSLKEVKGASLESIRNGYTRFGSIANGRSPGQGNRKATFDIASPRLPGSRGRPGHDSRAARHGRNSPRAAASGTANE